MPVITDPEFGHVALRRSKLARNVRLKLDARGVISISLPMRTPLFMAKQLLEDSRKSLRKMLADIKVKKPSYKAGDMIGKSHVLRFEQSLGDYGARLKGNELVVSCPATPDPRQLEQTIHSGIGKALHLQANSYLPRRLKQLADDHGFSYQRVRFSSAGTRWGSCSSKGTISLNIWLMQLPFELIDYVMIHELCHTKHMNHSSHFWDLVDTLCPDYRVLRRQLRDHHPSP